MHPNRSGRKSAFDMFGRLIGITDSIKERGIETASNQEPFSAGELITSFGYHHVS